MSFKSDAKWPWYKHGHHEFLKKKPASKLINYSHVLCESYKRVLVFIQNLVASKKSRKSIRQE